MGRCRIFLGSRGWGRVGELLGSAGCLASGLSVSSGPWTAIKGLYCWLSPQQCLVPFLHIRAGQSAIGKGNGIIRQNLTSSLGSAPDLLCNLDK